MDLVVTGATGFVGLSLALGWLRRNPAARIGCLVRATDAEAAQIRLHAALRQAASDEADLDSLLARADAILGDLDDAAWIDRAQAWMRSPPELVHGAANLSFRETDRAAAWRSNVGGTAAMLRALPRLPGLAAFNYISTAYVAGDRQGEILEDEHVRPPHFVQQAGEVDQLRRGHDGRGSSCKRVSYPSVRPGASSPQPHSPVPVSPPRNPST